MRSFCSIRPRSGQTIGLTGEVAGRRRSPPAAPVIPAGLSGGFHRSDALRWVAAGDEPRSTRGQEGGTSRRTSVTYWQIAEWLP
jgi:hypothetical protein